MRPGPTSGRYTGVAVALHWLVAALVIGQIAFGWYLSDIPKGSRGLGTLINLHKSFGLTVWALVVIRLGWRMGHRPPELPISQPHWQRIAANANHAALYVCLVALPLAGYLGSNFSKHGILLYGLVRLPPWGSDDKALYALFNKAHIVISYVLVALIAVHIAAALYHAIRRDGIFSRMRPRAASRESGESPARISKIGGGDSDTVQA